MRYLFLVLFISCSKPSELKDISSSQNALQRNQADHRNVVARTISQSRNNKQFRSMSSIKSESPYNQTNRDLDRMIQKRKEILRAIKP